MFVGVGRRVEIGIQDDGSRAGEGRAEAEGVGVDSCGDWGLVAVVVSGEAVMEIGKKRRRRKGDAEEDGGSSIPIRLMMM